MDASRECQPSQVSCPTSYHHHQQHHRSLKLTMVNNRLGGKMSLSQYQTALAAMPRQLPALLPGLGVTSTPSSDGGRPGEGPPQWL